MLNRNWKIVFIFVSQLFDILAIWMTGAIIFTLKWGAVVTYITPDHHLIIGFILFTVIYISVASMLGLYRGSFHLSLRLQYLIMARAFVLSTLIALALNSFSQTFIGKRSVISFVILLPPILFLGRLLLRQFNFLCQKIGYGIHNALIVGTQKDALKIYQRFEKFPDLGYRIKGFVVPSVEDAKSIIPLYTIDKLEEIIKEKQIDRIFFPMRNLSLNGFSDFFSKDFTKGVKLKILSPQAEELLKVSRIYDIAGVTLSSPPRTHLNMMKNSLKRIFDFFGALCIILLLSPLFVVTMLAIYFESKGPIFFLQKRSAIKGGKEFYFIKFRSMVVNAEELKAKLEANNESDGALFKMKKDPRVTKVGKIIRKLSIDELPQLFNVLKGDMSLVGPRPLPNSDFEKAKESDEFWEAVKDRALVKPGMTGLWQVSGRSEIKFKEMLLLDLYYIENHSLMFDLQILFDTIPVVLFGRGAY
ncbi:MAG: sugar transferase [Bacteroidetes bacterium]|nr:sugar transferase [Bacteroidota bacterium]